MLEIALTATVLNLDLSDFAHLSFKHLRVSLPNLGQIGKLFMFSHFSCLYGEKI